MGHNAKFVDPEMNPEVWVERFESEGREVYDRRAAIVAGLRVVEGSSVADLGAGTGAHITSLSDAVGDEGHVFAIELAPRFVDHLNARKEAEGWDRVTVLQSTAESAALEDASVDLVLMVDVYHHLDDPAAMLADLHRSLRPGGRIAIVDFERIPGVSSDWVMNHVSQSREEVIAEVEATGSFGDTEVLAIEGLSQNFVVVMSRR